MKRSRGGLVGLITLGCDKNTVDMEYIAGALDKVGLRWCVLDPEVPAPEHEPDAVVILTCGFVGDAKRQSVEALAEWAERKKRSGIPRLLAAAGCLSQRYGDALASELPELDLICGVGEPEKLAEQLRERLDENLAETDTPPVRSVSSARPDMCWKGGVRPRIPLTRSATAFLKISDGCDHACAFCAIPSMKGPHRSVPREILLAETRALLRRGVRELVLVAQDTTAYGRDLYENYGLPELLADLDKLSGQFWIRVLYAYPTGLSSRLVDAMASLRRVAPYLDMPLQHLDPDMLRRMRRPVRAADPAVLVDRLRRAVPGIALRTTFIVGHPGETRRAFSSLLAGLRSLRFNWAGAFAWSPEEGTPSASQPGRPDPRTARRRLERLMEAQAEITAAWNAERIGSVEEMLIESVDPDADLAVGRSVREAPEVDGTICLRGGGRLKLGDLVPVRITGAAVYDLEAVPL